MVRAIALLMAAGLAAPGTITLAKAASGPAWQAFEVMPEGTIYVDPSSIVRQGNRADMWVLIDYKQPQDDRTGKKIKSDKLHYRYDCSTKHFSILNSSVHAAPMGGGAVIDVNADPQITPVPPGTTAEQMWRHACAGAN